MPELTVYGYSDDLIEVEISEHMGSSSRTLFKDEMSNESVLSINGHFEIHSTWTNNGLLLGIVILNEDIVLENYYTITYSLTEAHYTPKLVVDSSIPISIKGIYGDNLADLRKKLYLRGFDDDEIDNIITFLQDEKLILI